MSQTTFQQQEEQDITPNLADISIPMSDIVSDVTATPNDAPPPLPELYDPTNEKRQVPYIVTLGLGKDGIRKELVDERDSNFKPTGKKVVQFTVDLVCRAIAPFDQREINMAAFDTFLRPKFRWTSKKDASQDISELAYLGVLAGLDLDTYADVDAMVRDLVTVLGQKGADATEAKAFIQWTWYSPETIYKNKNGVDKKGKDIRWGMKAADEFDPITGAANPTITHRDTGEKLRAKAVLSKLEKLV